MRMPLIHTGGGLFFLGSLNRLSPYDDFLVSDRIMYISTIVMENPNSGEINKDMPIFDASLQFTASLSASGSNE